MKRTKKSFGCVWQNTDLEKWYEEIRIPLTKKLSTDLIWGLACFIIGFLYQDTVHSYNNTNLLTYLLHGAGSFLRS